ncbi:molybdopterin-dependent oxidoreductase [Plastoroseomonas arctica]|uniref:Molybdopterin-dependent oxidoreductase n=1 Tax=Plastoroseomonas arctica TaxID=1509237 RepID=A0AAF1K001_9PROT|nr:molybdopterin-dependent oxidoreductase [Plastoroseomonas arctica]
MEATRTTCPYCGVGCGVLARPDGTVAGDPEHPANFGRLCSKGAALGETIDLPGRLLYPEVGGKRASWDAALDAVAEGFSRALRQGGPDSTALYVSGQLLTEDYYAANKFAKGFLGTANIDSNSRLCMASSVAAHRRAFGEDIVPAVYADLEQADLVTLVGSNLAWCHPVLHQRLMAAKAARPQMRIVVVDPRVTATCAGADLHLPLAPGSDVALFAAVLARCADAGFAAPGMEDALAVARGIDPGLTGLAPDAIATFCDWFARTEKSVTLWSQGVNQSGAGTDKANAIINCHILTERIGKPGASPFSITGQPNAMGGREVGALANTLAAHLDWSVPAEVAALRDAWGAPNLAMGPGLKAVDLFRALGAGTIGALWVMATNPAVSLPDGDGVRAALKRAPFLVVSDCTRESDTVDAAHVRLPALGWGEKDGTVTNSERVISRQRAFLPRGGEARPDWWAVAQVAKRLGFGEAFAWDGPAAIFREHAALTALVPESRRAFDISGLAEISDADYAAMPPTRWPVASRGAPGERLAPAARFIPTPYRGLAQPGAPLTLLTGRLRDQWHMMTRTGPLPRLMAQAPEPELTLHPDDAAGIADGALVRLGNAQGSAVLRARLDAGQRRGSCFAPMHWTARFCVGARVNAAVLPVVDPISGQPELKGAAVAITRYVADWQGFVLAGAALDLPAAWMARSPMPGGVWRHEVAGEGDATAAFAALRAALPETTGHWAVLEDAVLGLHRAVLLREARVIAVVCLARASDEVPRRDWLAALMAEEGITLAERRCLLAGEAAEGPPPSPTLCACHGVTVGRIEAAILDGAEDVAAVGAATKAGTGCGACRPEIAAILARAPVPA